MADQKLHKITIKNKKPGEILHGGNAEIYVDDVEIKGATFLKLELKPSKFAKVVLEMYVSDFIVDENIGDTNLELAKTDLILDDDIGICTNVSEDLLKRAKQEAKKAKKLLKQIRNNK